MRKCGRYICAQWKRICKVFPTVLATTLVLFGSMALLMWMVLEKDTSSDKKQMIQIGLTGDLEGSYLGIGIQTIQGLDSSRFAVSFVDMTEKEAKEKLMQGKISAYVIVPDGFVESVTSGENLPITYVTSAGAAGVTSMVMNEIVGTVSKVIVESQNAIYGAQGYMLEHNMGEIYWDATNALYLRLANFILGRTQIYELKTLGVSNGLSLTGYYTCAILVLFLLLWGIAGSPLFVKRNHALPKLLKARGQGTFSQAFSEYAAYAVLMLGTLLFVFVLLVIAMEVTGLKLPEWKTEGAGRWFTFGLQMIPVSMLTAAMQFLLYEIVDGMVGGILAQFLSALCLGYLSGCFYPISFFPETIQKISAWLPTGAAVQYAGKCMLSLPAGRECMIMAIYWFCFLGLAIGVRSYKVKHN